MVSYFKKGYFNSRTNNLLLQISLGVFLKGLLFLISYLQIPFFAQIFNKDQLGLWLTYISFYNWFILFDFGIGHGLKNILSEKLSTGSSIGVKEVATNGILTSLFFSALLFVALILGDFLINYSVLFKTEVSNVAVEISLFYTIIACIILFFNNAINSLMNASQKSSYTNLLNLCVNVLIVVAIFFYQKSSIRLDPLIFLSKANFWFYIIVFVTVTVIYLFKNPIFIPSLALFRIKIAKQILHKGLQFFLIQITVLLIFPIDSFLVSNLVSSGEAGRYGVIVKLFSYTVVFVSIINQSSWPAFTEAFCKRDYTWIKKTFFKINILSIIVLLSLLPIAYFSELIIYKWTGVRYEFSREEIIVYLFLHIFYVFSFNYTTLLYSINELGSQIKIGLFLGVFKISLVYALLKCGLISTEYITLLSAILFFILFIYNYFVIKNRISALQ